MSGHVGVLITRVLLRRRIRQHDRALAAHRAACERLMTRVRTLEESERSLRAKTAAYLHAGNREVAAQHALELRATSATLADASEQLEAADATYKQLLHARELAVEAAREKLARMTRSHDARKIERAAAELTKLATTLSAGNSTLARLDAMLDEERRRAAERARMAHDALSREASGRGDDDRSPAEQALDEFVASWPPQA
jgi:hypothetical protein